jgi:quercetin dioxygenase-like cupin family protein
LQGVLALENVIKISKGISKRDLDLDGKLLKLMFKSGKMEGIMIEVEPGKDFGKQYSHDGEEIHYVLEGEIEYIVGDEIYKLTEGDSLWHKSDIPHSVRNIGSSTAKFITIGVPPTFM